MTLLSAYLSKSKVKKVLSTKPGQEGFSLIELVVVVAVLAVLSALAIPQFTDISQKARAAAASNTVATIAKECAVKLADANEGEVIVPALQGYDSTRDSDAGFRWTPTVADGTTAEGATLILPGDTYTCAEANVFGMISEDTAVYPNFSYNTSNTEKLCQATTEASQNRGCQNGTNW